MNAGFEAPSRSDYNPIAGFYHKHWCGHYHAGLNAMLERILLKDLRTGARLLDICCGTGTVAGYLIQRGFSVTGVDASEEMLRFARQEVHEGEFLAANIENFRLPALFDAALCTFDSLSYLPDEDALVRAFSNVHAALRPNGRFVFDLSSETAYETEWKASCAIVEPNEAYFVRGSYDQSRRCGRTSITTFQLNGSWKRTDVEFLVRCHTPEEVFRALTAAHFVDCVRHCSDRDQELRCELGPNRSCYVARKA